MSIEFVLSQLMLGAEAGLLVQSWLGTPLMATGVTSWKGAQVC